MQIQAPRNKFEVALHRLSDDFSEQIVLHHVEIRPKQNHHHPTPINIAQITLYYILTGITVRRRSSILTTSDIRPNRLIASIQ